MEIRECRFCWNVVPIASPLDGVKNITDIL